MIDRVFALLCCLALTAAAADAPPAAYPENSSSGKTGIRPGLDKPSPEFHISSFEDIEAYFLTLAQKKLRSKLTVTLTWVPNADVAHADLRSGAADLVYMSYDDTLSMALQEGYRDVVAAWPVHGSMMTLCGTINVTAGLVYVGIDTDTGYARMLRQYLKSTLSPADYAQIQWVYAGATNLRYEQLVAGTLNATLLNEPFTAMLPPGVPQLPFDTITGPIQGTVGNIQRAALSDPARGRLLSIFYECYMDEVRYQLGHKAVAVAGLAKFYNVSKAVATSIYAGLLSRSGIEMSGCFEEVRLANVDAIFAADTGISIPSPRWWVSDWGCQGKRRRRHPG